MGRILGILAVTFALVSPAWAAENQATESGGFIRLFLMPAYPVKMGWDSPRQLTGNSAKAMIANKAHSIGHVALEIQCPTGGRDSHIVTGFTPVTAKHNFNLLFKDVVGLGILEVSWPGKLESEQDVFKAVDYRKKNKDKLAIMTFLVSETSCRRMLDYLHEFKNTSTPLWYGNSPQPRRHEGAGCSSFGVSFLEIAGIMTEDFRKDWIVARRVPLATMGGYVYPKVSIMKLLTMPESRRWSTASEPHMALETYEPAYMYNWVRELVGSPSKLKALGGEIDKELAKSYPVTPAIRIDRRSVPTPTEPMFKPGPFLQKVRDYAVIRSDKVVSPNGSFEIKP
jgi:hypothetical protein